jgi:hypothetical protein
MKRIILNIVNIHGGSIYWQKVPWEHLEEYLAVHHEAIGGFLDLQKQ